MNIAIILILFVLLSTCFVQYRMKIETERLKLPPAPKKTSKDWDRDPAVVFITSILGFLVKSAVSLGLLALSFYMGLWGILFGILIVIPLFKLMWDRDEDTSPQLPEGVKPPFSGCWK